VSSVIVVGAGVFGAALADRLAGEGWKVTLVDRDEPGHERAESGGESRLIRCSHGSDPDYTATARRAWTLWRELEAESGDELLLDIGMAWFAEREDGWEAESERTMAGRASPRSGWTSARRRGCSRALAPTT
jgi:sarcosine oxidase